MSYLDKLQPISATTPLPSNGQPAGQSKGQATTGYKSKLQPIAESTQEVNPIKGGFLGEMFTGSTQRFGKTIGESLAAGKNTDLYSSSLENHTKVKNDLVTAINNKKKLGGDTARMEEALKQHEINTPKIEDFTGDVINKTAGQVIGEGIGTGLEALTGGLLSAGKKAVVSKTLSTFGKIKEGAKIGATYGAIGGGSGAMQQGGGVGDTIKGTALGGITGGVLGGGLGYAGAKAGQALDRYANRATILAEENLNKVDKVTGEILQGTPEDIARGKRALGNTDMSKVKTYAEGYDTLDAQVENLVKKQDKLLDKNLNVRRLDELNTTIKVGDQSIKHNFTRDALSQLENFFDKTNNQVEKFKIQQLIQKAETQGLTAREVNNIARIHGEKLNAFNANGELASGLTKQAAENTRMGLKDTVTEMFGSKASRVIDKEMADVIRVRGLFEDMAIKVNDLKQKIQPRTWGAKAGYLIGKVINTIGMGSPKGIVEALIPRGQGFKTLNAIDLEKALAKNLKILNDITNPNINETTLIQKLESFINEKILEKKPIIPIKKSSVLPKKPVKLAKIQPFKSKPNSKETPINSLIQRETADPKRVAIAKKLIQDALDGKIDKRDPVLIDKNNKIISGNTTLQAMKEMGYKNITTEVSPTAKELLAGAQLHTPIFRQKVGNIAKKLGLEVEHGPVKTEKRLLEKANQAYKGNIMEVGDINRSVMFVKPLDNKSKEFFKLHNLVKKEFDVIRTKFTLGTPSYNKILINVNTPAGISEIQLTTKELWNAKMYKGGDVLYGIARNQRTPKKIATHLNTRMEELYQFVKDAPFEKATKGSNEGGFTYDLIKGIDFGGTPHISVSPFPERTMKLKGKTTTMHLAEFLKNNFDLLKKKGFAVGGWYNKADKMTYLDVVIPVPKQHAKLAEKLGNKSNQIAGFDLENFTEIAYKGDGTIVKVAPMTERMQIIDEIFNKGKVSAKLTPKPPKLGKST